MKIYIDHEKLKVYQLSLGLRLGVRLRKLTRGVYIEY